MNKLMSMTISFALISAFASVVSASELSTPNTFTGGSRAVAAEVNDNFAAVQEAVNDNNTRVTANEMLIQDNAALIDSNVMAISDNSAAVTAAGTADAVAYAASENTGVTLNTTDTVVRSLTVSAPGDGHVVATFGAWVICTSGNCVPRCSMEPDGSIITTRNFTLQSVPTNGYGSLSITAAFPIAAGDTTLTVVCDMFAGSGTLGDPSITAVFSTKDYSLRP